MTRFAFGGPHLMQNLLHLSDFKVPKEQKNFFPVILGPLQHAAESNNCNLEVPIFTKFSLICPSKNFALHYGPIVIVDLL